MYLRAEFDLQSWCLALKPMLFPTILSMLFRFLELLTLSLLVIPLSHYITYNFSNILIELNRKNTFGYLQEVKKMLVINLSEAINLQVAISVILREKLDGSFCSLLG